MRPRLSVIIPTRNNATSKGFSLHYALASLNAQKRTAIEIIIVDDCGTDSTIGTLTQRFPRVRIIRSDDPVSNVGKLRNTGAMQADADVLVFLDDDTVLTAVDALAKMADLTEDYEFGCGARRFWSSIYWSRYVNERQSVSSMTRTLRDISFLPKGINREVGFRDLNEFTFIGSFGFVSSAVFHDIGRFDSEFPGWGFEDTDLMMRLCMAETRHVLLGDHGIDVVHLTHAANNTNDYHRNMERFNKLERQRGYYFHANHFFGVYEADGFALLTPISSLAG